MPGRFSIRTRMRIEYAGVGVAAIVASLGPAL